MKISIDTEKGPIERRKMEEKILASIQKNLSKDKRCYLSKMSDVYKLIVRQVTSEEADTIRAKFWLSVCEDTKLDYDVIDNEIIFGEKKRVTRTADKDGSKSTERKPRK